MADINVISLFQQVFGYKGIPMGQRISTRILLLEDTADDVPVIEDAHYSDLVSVFGTPIFMPVKLDNMWLPNEPLITINGVNTIIKTPLTGVKGSVKEFINTEDYQISIKGLIINEESDDLPEEMVRSIRTICEKRQSVDIENRLLTLFDIHQVAIETFSFPGVEGYQNIQAYEINCISDWPLDLILKEQK